MDSIFSHPKKLIMRGSIIFFIGVSLFFIIKKANAQQTYSITTRISVSDKFKETCNHEGRFLVFLVNNKFSEPRYQIWPSPSAKSFIFGKTFTDFSPTQTITVDKSWQGIDQNTLSAIPEGEYSIQVLYDQSNHEANPNEAGNLYSTPQSITLNENKEIDLILDSKIEEKKVIDHPLVRHEIFKSEILSSFWNKPMHLHASILLPKNYDNKKIYPIRYNVAGYSGRYTRVIRLIKNKKFMDWYMSTESPEVITVFLDGDGPFGDSYQMNSDNSGPYGESLITELIPYIESKYRGTQSSETRFVDGCSTGGWVSLGLQLYYPETFNGCFSYSPDAVEFENYQLINIYKDENAYINEFGNKRPVMRSTAGEPMLNLERFISYENVLGRTGTYVTSGGQFSAHTALYGPKGQDGYPVPLFDPITGMINKEVAKHWEKYDFKKYLEKNADHLVPKLKDKIYVWMGDMDNFYLNPSTRQFSEFVNSKYPEINATFEFEPMAGHCTEFSNQRVLEQIQERLEKIK